MTHQKTQLPINLLPPIPKLLLGWTDHANDTNADRHNHIIDYIYCASQCSLLGSGNIDTLEDCGAEDPTPYLPV